MRAGEAGRVVIDTSDPATRRTGIGGSDAAAILGLNPYQTRYAVAVEKIHGVKPAEDAESRERMDWGKRLEPLLRSAFEERTGMPVHVAGSFVRHPEHEWMYANPDGFLWSGLDIVDDEAFCTRWASTVPQELVEMGPGLFEGKCSGVFDAAEWGDSNDQLIPVHYYVQAQHYMAVTDRAWCGFGCLLNGNKFIVRWAVRDEAFIAGRLIPELEKFWAETQQGLLSEPMDPFIDEQVLRALHRESAGSRVELTDEQTRAVYRWADAHEQKARSERQEAALKLAVKSAMGTASIGKLTTGEQITFKTDSAGRRLLRAPHKPSTRKP